MKWVLIVTVYVVFSHTQQMSSKTATLMASQEQCMKVKALVEKPSPDYKVVSEVEASCHSLDDVEVNWDSAD